MAGNDVTDLVERARKGDPRAVARLISHVEDGSPLLREVMAALDARTRARAYVVGLTGSTGRRQVHDHVRAGHGVPRAGQAGRRAGRGPLLAVLRRRAARRPGADAGARDRPRRLHPLDGLARPPRRAVGGHAAGGAGARRRRLRRGADRDGRRRAVRGGDRRDWPTPRWCCWRRAWATGSRRPRPGSWRSATCSWSTRPTATAPTRPRASWATCWRSASPAAPGTGVRRS